MRITSEAKRETRERILAAARRLFVARGFEATTIRELASEARIAAGTLFNYFESKEALAVALVGEALQAGLADFRARLRGDEELEEQLFLHVITGLRRLEAYRSLVGTVLETALSPFARSGISQRGGELRVAQLEVVEELIAKADGGAAQAVGAVTLHLYWTLYLGVMAFWSGDESPQQEDTLGVLDESLRVFALALANPAKPHHPAVPAPGPATRS